MDLRRFGFLIILAAAGNGLFAGSPPIQPGADGKSWTLRTRSSVYGVSVRADKTVGFDYFGGRKQPPPQPGGSLRDEVPARNARTTTGTIIESTFPDRVRYIDLTYDGAEIREIDGYATLSISQKDKFYPFEVVSNIRVLPEYDLIEKWLTVRNTDRGKKGEAMAIENLLSGSIFLPGNGYELTYYSGRWGREFQPQVTKLTPGLKTIQVKDFKSYGSSFFAVRPEGDRDEFDGETWFGMVDYSGNWKVDFETGPSGEVQILGGLNFWDQEIRLKAGESFTTPRILFGYTREGLSGASIDLVSYTRARVLRGARKDAVRPVIYNSWFVTGFDVGEKNQLELAKAARDLGVETFVMDDGWYRSKKGAMSLGDWTPDEAKFPHGLGSLVRKINGLGLDFGIWVEPESIVSTSDLFRAHPDWIFGYPHRDKRIDPNRINREDRYHLLNLGRADVYEYLHGALRKLLKENNIRYLKWDMNNLASDVGCPAEPAAAQLDVRLRYVENLYRLTDALRTEFPDVWFENCAGGGGRIDLGMMARSDLSWVSDNTDPVDRIFMHYSYLSLFPAATMFDLVTDGGRQGYPLGFKFDAAMSGVLGIGADILRWPEEERRTAREKIALYKEIRKTVQFGTPYRLVSPYEGNRSVLQFVNGDRTESVLFVYNLAETSFGAAHKSSFTSDIKLRGLLPDADYTIGGLEGARRGKDLMDQGFPFPVQGAFRSGIFKLTKKS
jgi:alpha-galactosidase